jgi:hypothetical protein
MSKNFGVILIVIGIVMLVWTSFTYTKKENVVDAGPIHISADRQKTVSWPPVAGGIVIIAGILVYVIAGKNVETNNKRSIQLVYRSLKFSTSPLYLNIATIV